MSKRTKALLQPSGMRVIRIGCPAYMARLVVPGNTTVREFLDSFDISEKMVVENDNVTYNGDKIHHSDLDRTWDELEPIRYSDSWKRNHWILVNNPSGFERLFNNKPAEEDTCD